MTLSVILLAVWVLGSFPLAVVVGRLLRGRSVAPYEAMPTVPFAGLSTATAVSRESSAPATLKPAI